MYFFLKSEAGGLRPRLQILNFDASNPRKLKRPHPKWVIPGLNQAMVFVCQWAFLWINEFGKRWII